MGLFRQQQQQPATTEKDWPLVVEYRDRLRRRLTPSDFAAIGEAVAALKGYGLWVGMTADKAAEAWAAKGHASLAADAQAWAAIIWEAEELQAPQPVLLPGEDRAAVAAVITKAPKGSGPVLPQI